MCAATVSAGVSPAAYVQPNYLSRAYARLIMFFSVTSVTSVTNHLKYRIINCLRALRTDMLLQELELLAKEYKDIIDVYSRCDEMDKSPYYAYDSLYLKHTITISIAC